jgi:diguanylate cyclase (GGDEF)-like protein
MFVDQAGAIQAHRDPRMVDFHSLTKDTKAKKTIFQQIDDGDEATALAGMMQHVSSGTSAVESRFMRVGGREMLVGVGYLDRLGWFNVTLMDIDAIIDRKLFSPIAALLAAMMAAAAVLITVLFRRSVLDRLAAVEASARRVEKGDFDAIAIDQGRDEIGRLSRTFAAMAIAVHDHTRVLEEMVAERTEKLRRAADMDSLTGILNRRGFLRRFEQVHAAASLTGATPGVLLIDLDCFKDVNDGCGHLAGDRLLAETARRLSSAMAGEDACGRWGGDEFIALIADCDSRTLPDVCAQVSAAIKARPMSRGDEGVIATTVSIGAARVAVDEPVEAAVARADAALYDAKRAGRDRFVIFETAGVSVLPSRVAQKA